MVLFNPEIIWSSEDQSTYEEGCLSIPDQYAEVKRPAAVTGALDWTWTAQEQERQFEGLWATCVQHEIDHLNGKLFIDYLGPLKRQMITRKMEKLKRERRAADDRPPLPALAAPCAADSPRRMWLRSPTRSARSGPT